MADKEKEDTINSLIDQLKTVSSVSSDMATNSDEPEITEDNIQAFIMQKSAALVNQSLETLQMYQDMITTSPNAEDVDAYSSLAASTTKALETLNKLAVQDKRSKSAMDIKKLDIEGRRELQENQAITNAYVSSREEMFKKLMDESEIIKVIDVSTSPLSSES